MAKKIAVVLFNLGGPDNTDSVEPFLFNLFYDKAIINLPNPFRFFLAKLISKKRAPIAKHIYEYIGGRSPIVLETKKQANKLEEKLNNSGEDKYKVFISMRYWHPFSSECIFQVNDYCPDEVILLPLYPQFSASTTGSSVDDWKQTEKKYQINYPTKTICCYPTEANFINSHVGLIKKTYDLLVQKNNYRILFSAHGLPKKNIDAGDPYQHQVEKTVESIVKNPDIENLDYSICYQSKVGKLEWIGPSTDSEIIRTANDNKSIILVPVAFVSEHSETLVELDIEYKKLSEENGVKEYLRVPALGSDEFYIDSLVGLCKLNCETGKICSGNFSCDKKNRKCALNSN